MSLVSAGAVVAAVVVGAALLGAVVVLVLQYRMLRFLKSVPGPPAAPFFGSRALLRRLAAERGGYLHAALAELSKRYGHVFKVSYMHRAVVVVSHPKDVERVISIVDCPKMTRFYTGLNMDGILTIIPKDYHRYRRSLVEPFFTASSLHHLPSTSAYCMKRLFDKLDAVASSSSSSSSPTATWLAEAAHAPRSEFVNVASLFSAVTMDVIGNLAFGVDFDNVRNPAGPLPWAVAILMYYAMQRTRNPLYNLLPHMHVLQYRATRVLLNTVLAVLRERRASGARSPPDIIDLMLREQNNSSSKWGKLSDESVVGEMVTFLLAGHETSGHLMSFATFFLGTRAEWQDRIRAEAEAVVGPVPDGPDADAKEQALWSNIRPEQLRSMRVTRAVLDETLRLRAVAPATGRTLAEPLVVGGHDERSPAVELPAGADVVVSFVSMGMDERLWPDAMRFDPARFLDASAAADRERFAFVPFSAGTRSCIGRQFAYNETTILLAMFLRRYDVALQPSADSSIEQAVTLRPRGGVYVRLRRRL